MEDTYIERQNFLLKRQKYTTLNNNKKNDKIAGARGIIYKNASKKKPKKHEICRVVL